MIRGTKRQLEETRPTIKADFLASIHNRFDIEVVDAKTGEVKNKAVAHNVICDKLWTYLLKPGTYFNAIHYGTGTGTPSASDTQLFSFYGAISGFKETTYGADIKNGVTWCRRRCRIEPSDAIGVEISEIGIAQSATQTTLCTHAMLKDMNGNEITIQKTDTDVINIYATVFVHHSVFDDGSGIIFPYHHLTEEAEATASDSKKVDPLFTWLLGVYWTTSGNQDQELESALINYGASNPSMRMTNGFDYTKMIRGTPTYLPSEKKMVFKLNQIAVDVGNLSSGIMGIIIQSHDSAGFRGFDGVYLNSDGAWWPGSTVTGDPIGTGDGVTTDFSTKFSFPRNAQVYVDGAPVSAVVSSEPLRYDDMGIYFIPVEFAHTAIGYDTMRSPWVSLQDIPVNQGVANNDKVTGMSVFYNPYYNFGVASGISASSDSDYTLEVSDDLEIWHTISLGTSVTAHEFSVPAEHQHRKFWRVTALKGTQYRCLYNLTAPGLTGKNIHFDTPPAAGAVITADYTTPVIAKDENHVFDLTVTFQFGEFNPDA